MSAADSKKPTPGSIRLREFTFSDIGRAEVERYIDQHFLAEERIEPEPLNHLADLIREVAPTALLDTLRELAYLDDKLLLRMQNVPTTSWSSQLADFVEADSKNPLGQRVAFRAFREHWFTSGLIEAQNLLLAKTNVLIRPRSDGKISGPDVHRDMNPFSLLSVVCNFAPANTEFVDFERAVASLPLDLKQRLLILDSGATTGSLPLLTIEQELGVMRYNRDGKVHAIVPHQDSKECDLRCYEDAVALHSHSLSLTPGSIVAWNSLYHRALPARGHHLVPFGTLSRVSIFWGSGLQSS